MADNKTMSLAERFTALAADATPGPWNDEHDNDGSEGGIERYPYDYLSIPAYDPDDNGSDHIEGLASNDISFISFCGTERDRIGAALRIVESRKYARAMTITAIIDEATLDPERERVYAEAQTILRVAEARLTKTVVAEPTAPQDVAEPDDVDATTIAARVETSGVITSPRAEDGHKHGTAPIDATRHEREPMVGDKLQMTARITSITPSREWGILEFNGNDQALLFNMCDIQAARAYVPPTSEAEATPSEAR